MDSRGGKRCGSGRKPRPDTRKVPVCIRLDRDLLAYLRSVGNKTGPIESALRDSQGYKDWVDELLSPITVNVPDENCRQEIP